MRYLRDQRETAERIAELAMAVDYARYELGAALKVAHQLGMTWTQLAEVMGMTKAGASQFSKRQMSPGELSADEHDRICDLIGAGDRVVRYEVRVITSGKPGVSKVTRAVLSRHLKRDVAERRCDERGPDAELWTVYPDGTAQQTPIRLPAMRAAQAMHPDDLAELHYGGNTF